MPDLAGTVEGELTAAAALLAAAGLVEPRREALRLWSALAERSPGETWLARDHPVPADQTDRFRRAVERVAAGEPLQYVVGSTGFRRLTIRCDRRALIPRPETEGLVELALALVPSGRALDLGTGTGCIALALADEGRFRSVTGVDRSADALELARVNAAAAGLAVRWLEGDWCGPVRGEWFDLIVANPPYITSAEVEGLDRSVRDWEPRPALDGGADGLRDVAALLRETPAVLAPGGWLVLELDSGRAEAGSGLARTTDWKTVAVHEDLFGRPRYLAARRESNDA